MNIKRKDIEYIAKLSKLELVESEKVMFVSQLSEILSYIEKLNELDTENVKPMVNTIELYNVFRSDELKPSFSIEETISNSPAMKGSFFKVPRVIE